MVEVFREYLPAILIAIVIGLVVGFLIFRPRQRVRLTDSAPIRPHMTSAKRDSRRLLRTPLPHPASAGSQLYRTLQPRRPERAPGLRGAAM